MSKNKVSHDFGQMKDRYDLPAGWSWRWDKGTYFLHDPEGNTCGSMHKSDWGAVAEMHADLTRAAQPEGAQQGAANIKLGAKDWEAMQERLEQPAQVHPRLAELMAPTAAPLVQGKADLVKRLRENAQSERNTWGGEGTTDSKLMDEAADALEACLSADTARIAELEGLLHEIWCAGLLDATRSTHLRIKTERTIAERMKAQKAALTKPAAQGGDADV